MDNLLSWAMQNLDVVPCELSRPLESPENFLKLRNAKYHPQRLIELLWNAPLAMGYLKSARGFSYTEMSKNVSASPTRKVRFTVTQGVFCRDYVYCMRGARDFIWEQRCVFIGAVTEIALLTLKEPLQNIPGTARWRVQFHKEASGWRCWFERWELTLVARRHLGSSLKSGLSLGPPPPSRHPLKAVLGFNYTQMPGEAPLGR